MFTSQVVKDINGQHYIICLRNFSTQTRAVKPLKFFSSQACLQFVNTLKVPAGLWQSLAASNSFYTYQSWKSQHPHLSIQHYIAEALFLGVIQVVKTADVQSMHQQTAKAKFKDQYGKRFQLQPAAALLFNNAVTIKAVHNLSDAQQLVEQFELDDRSIAELLNINSTNNTKAFKELLSDALVNGEFVVIEQPPAHVPKVTTEYVESRPASNNDQPAPQKAKQQTESAPVSNERAENGSADALTKAAESGAPFCEECEKNQNAA